MALSNVLREPRRELIEQGLGVLAIGGFIGFDYIITSLIFADFMAPTTYLWADFAFAMFVGAAAIFLGFIGLHIIHWIGEAVCGAMARRGYDPRPTRRY